MASGSTTSVSNEQRRWVVIGVCLTKVLTPALRNVLATEIPKWHQDLCRKNPGIDKQVYRRHRIQFLRHNYENINNNHDHESYDDFDYKVEDPLSLAKLFVEPFMCKFTRFDEMDLSPILSVIECEAAPFTRAAAYAKEVRIHVRNAWAHCGDLANWTEAKFEAAFASMKALLRNVNLSPEEEQKCCDELNSWKDKGFQLCFGQPVDTEILTLLRDEVYGLREAVRTWSFEKEQMSTLLSTFGEIQTSFNTEINMRLNKHSSAIKRWATQTYNNSKKIKLLDERTNELSRYYIKEVEKMPYVFTAPPRNRYFAGRTEEIQKLKRILEVEETLNEKKVRVAAVCGLGGIGKTSLVCEYAHQMKDFYKGGVYWFSAEDDTHLRKTVNALAVKIGALLSSFDLTLPNILKKISTVHDPCLIVLDCLDQMDLSSNMMEFLSFPSQENIFGHFIVLTRRNPKRLVNDVSVVEEDFCLQLKCLLSREAKQFLFSRTNITREENVENVAECLCEELGRLPLALEQAGAYIQMRSCSFALYLEQYKVERLRLLRRQRARAAGNDSSERLAVHTTWLINMEYMKKSPDGQAAVRFMNACSFFDGNGIEEELINVGTPEVEDVAFCKCVSSPLGCREVLKLLTDFSLFTYVEASCVSTHRLVQELVWENLDSVSKAESFRDAVRILSYAFSKCRSPSNHVSLDKRNGEEQDISLTDPPDSPSHFYMWSKFCMHGHRLRRNIENLLLSLDSLCLDSVWFLETAKIPYECAVHLSANQQQEEAKRTLNFAYRILDWLPLAGYETVAKNVSNNLLFPLPIPLPQLFQTVIQQHCIPPFISLKPLTEKPASEASGLAPEASDLAPDASDFAPDASDLAPDASDLAPEASVASEASDLAPEASDLAPDASDLAPDASDLAPEASDLAHVASSLAPCASDLVSEASNLDLEKKIDKFELNGNKAFKEGRYEQTLDSYSSTINLAEDCNKPFDPLLLTNRSMVYIKLEQYENALKDANDYVTRRPYCWRGYALKALALDGLNKEVSADLNDKASAEIAAALAFYHNRNIFSNLPPFAESFVDLQNRIFICDCVDELLDAMFSQEVETGLLKILVLGSEEYILNSETVDKPWNNCILVGTRKNCSVSLKSNYDISLLKCMLTNLSFSFNESQLHCLPDSFVKILNCNFTSYSDNEEMYAVQTEGVFNVEQCNFTGSPLECSEKSCSVVHDCSFCNSTSAGISVLEGRTLKMENSRIYNNKSHGLSILLSECVAVYNCDIHDNGRVGICCERSGNSTLIRNNVYNNNEHGIDILQNHLAHIRENNLFDNGEWGILAQENPRCIITKNRILRNKTGGVFVDVRPEMENFSPPVVELNKACHNGGPGLEVFEVSPADSIQSAKFPNNEVHHNKEKDTNDKLNLSVPYCSYCRVKCKPTMCEKCFTTAYCSESCKKKHYSKHKEICKVLCEKSSYLITSTIEAEDGDISLDNSFEEDGSSEENDSSEEVDPKLPSPPRGDMRFVVKVCVPDRILNPKPCTVILSDRNRKLFVKFDSIVIDQVLKEFGVLGKLAVLQKKLYFHCLFEDNGHLRLFMNEFAEFQNW